MYESLSNEFETQLTKVQNDTQKIMDAQSDDQKLLVYQIEYLKEQNTKLNEKQKDDLN